MQAQRYESATNEYDSKALYNALRFFRPAGKKVFKAYEPLAVLRTDTGDAVQTYEEQHQLHRAHFAQQEAGHLITPVDYLDLPAAPKPQETYDLKALPSLSAVEQVIREAKDGKAPGPSGIPICVWKAFPTLSAEALLQVFLKAHLRLTEPIQYRCTKLTALFKKIGLAVCAESFSSIALLDPSAKLLHKLQRPCLLDALAERAQPLQQGCLPGSVPTALTHFLVTKMRIARARKQSIGVIFLDLTAAYYRLLRQALTEEEVSDDVLCQLLNRLQVPQNYVQDVAQFATNGRLLNSTPLHVRRVLASTFRHTFFVLDGLGDLTYTQVGTRPGDSVSDVLFSLALASVIDEVRSVLMSQGLPDAAMPVWADDLSLPVEHTARCLPDAVTTATVALHHACHKRAMSPNYAAGKTEALIAFAGVGSRKAATSLFGTGCGHLDLPVHPAVQLKCVLQYKHLGTTVSAKCRPRRDFQQKLGQAKGVAATLTRKVLRRQAVDVKHRANILDVLALSRAHYGAAVWGTFTAQEAESWHAGHGVLYRSLLRPTVGPDGPHFPNVGQICASVRRPLPGDTLRILRLEHLRLISTQQQEALLETLQLEATVSSTSWWAQVDADVHWLNALLAPKGPVYSGVQSFVDESLHSPGKVKAHIRRAKALAIAKKQECSAVTPIPAPEATLPASVTLPFACCHCERGFSDLHTLRAHMWAQHRATTFLAQHAPRETCTACLTKFWARPRLLRHLLHDSPACGHHVLAHLHRRNTSDGAEKIPQDTLPLRDLPATRVPGPLLPADSGFSPEHFLHLQGLGLVADNCPREAFAGVVRQSLSEIATASPSTLDAILELLSDSHADIFNSIVQEAGISVLSFS